MVASRLQRSCAALTGCRPLEDAAQPTQAAANVPAKGYDPEECTWPLTGSSQPATDTGHRQLKEESKQELRQRDRAAIPMDIQLVSTPKGPLQLAGRIGP